MVIAVACHLLITSLIFFLVGNIPYGTTEDQLHQIFTEAGRVKNIRMVVDHETGKPKVRKLLLPWNTKTERDVREYFRDMPLWSLRMQQRH